MIADGITGYRTPGCHPEREQEIRDWKAGMPGHGAGDRLSLSLDDYCPS
jgi:hypothetical protein